jgi:hypothetical protein
LKAGAHPFLSQNQKQKTMSTIPATDLTQHPPRSPRSRLGGYALIPRMLDKGRATIAGTNGEYHYACPLDQRILEFLGIDPEALKAELATGKGDAEIFAWIQANQKNKHTPEEIAKWTTEADNRAPDADSLEFFNQYLSGVGPNRADIKIWPDLLELDDYVSFGGKA